MHVIIGADDYLVAEAAKKAIGDPTGLEVIDSVSSGNAELQMKDLREASLSLATPPFLDPRKTTWWKNVHFLPGAPGEKKVSEEVKTALEQFAERLVASPPPPEQRFVLSGPRWLKTSLFAKTISKVAEVTVFAKEKPAVAGAAAIDRAVAAARECGLAFAPQAAEKFVSVVGTDTRSLISEIGKLRDYLEGDSTVVTCAAIDEVTSPGIGAEPEIWSVTDAIGRRDLESALSAMRKFELENGFAVFMSQVIEKFFRQLLDVAAGRTAGMNEFVVRKNRAFLRNWSPAELQRARERMLMLRERVVSGTVSGDVLVVTEVVRALRRPAPRR